MKKQLQLFLVLLLLPISLIAQDGYSFTLTHNGGYSFSVAAVPNYDSGTFTPKTESYGFTLVVPDGVTITAGSVQPTGSVIINANGVPQLIQGTDVVFADPTMSDKDLYQISVSTNAGNLPSHAVDVQLPLVTFTVDGAPVAGDLTVLDNGSALASNSAFGGALDSFIQVDVTDNGENNFINGYLGQSGMATFSFTTLGMIEIEELGLELYPNPTKGKIQLKGNVSVIKNIDVYNIAGQHVKRIDKDFNIIDITALESAVYLIKITNETSSFSARIIKN